MVIYNGNNNFQHADPVTQERGRCRVKAYVVAGVVVGDPEECSTTLLQMLRHRLAKPLATSPTSRA